MEHFYHCKSLWINHDYEYVCVCTWLVLLALKGAIWQAFSCCHHTRLHRVVIDLPPQSYPHPHPSSIMLKSGAVTPKMKSLTNDWLVQWKTRRTMGASGGSIRLDLTPAEPPKCHYFIFIDLRSNEFKWANYCNTLMQVLFSLIPPSLLFKDMFWNCCLTSTLITIFLQKHDSVSSKPCSRIIAVLVLIKLIRSAIHFHT